MIRNVASGDDEIAVQAGVVHGRVIHHDETPSETPAATPRGDVAPGDVHVVNVVAGNARVGEQHDVVYGDLHL